MAPKPDKPERDPKKGFSGNSNAAPRSNIAPQHCTTLRSSSAAQHETNYNAT